MLFSGCLSYNGPSSTPGASQPANNATTAVHETTRPTTGTIQVLVTDAPGNVSSVNITVSKVEVHKAGSDAGSGTWVSLNVTNQGQPFNLLTLQDGLTMVLAQGNEVEAGEYTQLRMTVFNVLVNTVDGPEEGYQAKVPSGTLKFVRPFTLEGGGAINLIVDFDAAKSVVFTGATKGDEPKVIFKPVVKLSIKGGQSTTEEETTPGEEEPTPLSEPTATFDPVSGLAETSITVAGTGWAADDTITSVEVGGEAATNDLRVDSDGNLSGTIIVPGTLTPGSYSILIEGTSSGVQTFTDAFSIT
jgi:hypothetical protein